MARCNNFDGVLRSDFRFALQDEALVAVTRLRHSSNLAQTGKPHFHVSMADGLLALSQGIMRAAMIEVPVNRLRINRAPDVIDELSHRPRFGVAPSRIPSLC